MSRFLWVLLSLTLVLPRTVPGQTVSPGPLSQVHAHLEGIKSCTQCHELGKRGLVAGRCLECHTILQTRIEKKLGFHGSSENLGKPCEACHREHAGREVPLVNWGGTRESFDHSRTGWSLEGAHRKAGCLDCHETRRIPSPEVRGYLAKNPGAQTFLGLDSTCSSCHFDEHRGQLISDCGSCHGLDSWKPAPRFFHDQSAYPLRGSHTKVACEKCHPAALDPNFAAEAFPKPRSASYLRYKPTLHAQCSSCHADPHTGRLGEGCSSCHTVDAWAATAPGEGTKGFKHDQTRFPLQGRHKDVACDRCHPVGAGGKGTLTGFPFARCADCHEDAHAGQIHQKDQKEQPADCSVCHAVTGFSPPQFSLDDHARTRFPLRSGHQAVPCLACHPADPALDRKGERRPPHTFRADPSRLDYGDRSFEDCATCHPDPHAGQFRSADPAHPARACADCHLSASFHDLQFDHARHTSFPLRGRHARTLCPQCHPAKQMAAPVAEALAPWFPRPPAGTLQIAASYRPTPVACEACHPDPHLGQFARAGATACGDCHTEDAFAPASRFDHARGRFVLTGAHSKARCAACHRPVKVLDDRTATLYQPLPLQCAGCHEDPHRGAFQLAGNPISCETCHGTAAWEQVRFDHDRTGFRLDRAHAQVPCSSCHAAGRKEAPPRDCAGCHNDPHGGALSAVCENCHGDAAHFRDPGSASFHERTRLPLLGRHAAIPCESCHGDRTSAVLAGLNPECVSCHLADYDRTGVSGLDHRGWGFSTSCQQCHDSFRWDRVTYAEHERCFRIHTGAHSRFSCLECHMSLPAQPTSACATMTAACTRCHSCNEMSGRHSRVSGFECKDRKCYECHPDAGGN